MPDDSSPLNERHKIARDLREQIRAGALRIGDRIPTGHELAGRYKVSHSTVTKAIRDLKDEGVLVGHPGKAVVVASVPTADQPPQPATLTVLAREVTDLKRRVSDLEQRVP